MTHVMLDLETLSTRVGCAIMQIGAVVFDLPGDNEGWDEGLLPSSTRRFILNVNIIDEVVKGAHIDKKTADWWGSRPTTAGLCASPQLPKVALDAFEQWYKHVKGSVLWSHGAAADIPWLEAMYHRHGREKPWHYRAPRDTRTLFWLAGLAGWDDPRNAPDAPEVTHDALQDAVDQAGSVQSAFKWLELKGLL